MGARRTFDRDQKREPAAPAKAAAVAGPAAQFEVGPSDDAYEREAHATADRVMAALAAGGDAGVSGSAGGSGATVRRAPAALGAAGGAVDGQVAARIEQARGGGRSLPDEVREPMERAFGGGGFGGVRLHDGAEAAELNAQLGARAFTVGTDIFLGAGAPALTSAAGQHLLAHELAHTRQRSGAAHRLIHRDGGDLPDWTSSTAPSLPGRAAAGSVLDKPIAAMEGAKAGTDAFGTFGAANQQQANLAAAEHHAVSGQWGDATAQHDIGYTAEALASFGLALEIAKAVRVFMNGNATVAEKVGAAGLVAGATASTAKSGADMVKTAQGATKTSITGIADSVLGEIASMVGVFNSGYKLVKTIVDLIQNAGDLTDQQKATQAMVAIRAALEVGKSVVDTINAFMAHLGAVVTGLIAAVPAIGIALDVCDIIMNGVNIGYAYVSWAEMRDDKRAFKPQTGKTRWGGNKSFKPQALAAVTADDKVQGELEQARQELVTAAAELEKAQSALKKALAKNPSAVSKGLSNAQITHAAAEKRHLAAQEESLRSSESARNSREYLLSKNLQTIAGKRIRRGVLNIALTLPALAGDIALLSGHGAAAGAGLKAGSGVAKLAAVGVRMGKQAYHDSRGDEKSVENKLKMYDGIIRGVTDHVVEANELRAKALAKPGATAELRKATLLEEKSLREMTASGMPPARVRRLGADGPALYTAWIKALKER